MALIVTKDNCNEKYAFNPVIMTVVIEESVTNLHPEMFAYCSNLREIENHASPNIITDSMIEGCRFVTINNVGALKEEKEVEQVEPVSEEVVLVVEKIKDIKSTDNGLSPKDINRLYYSINPEKRSTYGDTKEEVVLKFLSINPGRRLV